VSPKLLCLYTAVAHTSQFIGLCAAFAVPYGAVRAYITWRRIGGHLPCIIAHMSGKLGSTRGPRMTYAAALATIGAASQDILYYIITSLR
jgi:hypothetical protein